MRHTALRATRRHLIVFAGTVMLCSAAGAASAAEYAASTTKFELGKGYAAVTGNVGTTLSVAAHHYSYVVNAGTLNVFYHVQPSGGSTAHTFNMTVSNFGPRAIDQYHFQVGTSVLPSGDYYRRPDVDMDGTPDYLDADDDADTVPDTLDNAPWVGNLNQADADTDGWGDVIDFAPGNASVPGGLPVPNPLMLNENSVLFTPEVLSFGPTPTSSNFNSFMIRSNDTYLSWTDGSIQPGASATFSFVVNVPDGLPNEGFMVRHLTYVPEPTAATAALVASLIAAPAMRRRRRRTSGSFLSCSRQSPQKMTCVPRHDVVDVERRLLTEL